MSLTTDYVINVLTAKGYDEADIMQVADGYVNYTANQLRAVPLHLGCLTVGSEGGETWSEYHSFLPTFIDLWIKYLANEHGQQKIRQVSFEQGIKELHNFVTNFKYGEGSISGETVEEIRKECIASFVQDKFLFSKTAKEGSVGIFYLVDRSTSKSLIHIIPNK